MVGGILVCCWGYSWPTVEAESESGIIHLSRTIHGLVHVQELKETEGAYVRIAVALETRSE